ncbi:hypothetical protein HY612_01255 [Candidatus Roizmanbacteria bacterium]|nr:hypothetical protein [Candidatus Roizmanbacteria bacterium]
MQGTKEKFNVYRIRGFIMPLVLVFFLASFLTLALIANQQKRAIFSQAQYSAPPSSSTITPTSAATCRDGTPADGCCKSGLRCVEAAGRYLCIGASCEP